SAADCTAAPIRQLRQKGLLHGEVRRVEHADHEEKPPPREERHALNDDQQAALSRIAQAMDGRRHETILMHGVTGSGKTEVYIRAIEEAVRYGRQAIVLVPEISLTPQTKQRFRARFDRVAVLHSHLTGPERNWHWRRIARGEVQVVVGARSAVFAPVPNLGLVVLDEEHDASFKQDSTPRYHAVEVARFRAAAARAPLVLGSATPSLESYYRATTGEYALAELPRRVLDLPLPVVDALDLRIEFRDRRSRGAISRQLHQAVVEALRDGGQVILLLNRRGFSTHIQCPACGHTLECPHCDIALTHHRSEAKALCHYCDYETATPTHCPQCSFDGIRFRGLGTERLEQEVQQRFPGVACLRMDSDTMRKPGSHERVLGQFRDGKIQILLGTQMIAKGLDFPNVLLVGVINADTALHFP
ncbi:MAG: primosomal protein N', partial [Planctomycetales bacterium]|nr:primosomal protein N' [Planctomycetales bacterium]